jgi:signal transduction histidine kinase
MFARWVGEMVSDFQDDIDAVGRISAVPNILEVVCRITGIGFAAVARVTSDRWIACEVRDEIAFGLKPGGELKIETTICNEIRQSGAHVVIDHVEADPNWRAHHTPAMYGFQSYISMPIVLRNGSFFGTLCAIDPRPARVSTPEVVGMFKLFADLIAFHLDAEMRIAASEANLLSERETAKLREQFIAVLGHDLRNPLASISGAARLLGREISSDRGKSILTMMQASVNRMAGMIDNVMDFARAKLGGGWSLDLASNAMEPILTQVVAETRATFPDRDVTAKFTCERPVMCDRVRIAQMASNLIANALTHGDPAGPVAVSAGTDGAVFEFSVSNTGGEIPEAMVDHLFEPYVRSQQHSASEGLGLGLFIASEIAKAHGGRMSVISSKTETRFTFRMPLH